MAIIQNPVIGKATGQAGGFIFQSYNGKKIIRRLPFAPRNPDTPAQQTARSIFERSQFIFSPPHQLLYNLIYPLKPYSASRKQLLADVMMSNSQVKRLTQVESLNPTVFGNGQKFTFDNFVTGFVPEPMSGTFRIFFYPYGYSYTEVDSSHLYTFGQYSYAEKLIRIFELELMTDDGYFDFYIDDIGEANSNYINFIGRIPLNYSNINQNSMFTLI